MPPKTSRVLAWTSLLAGGVLLLVLLAAAAAIWRPSLIQPVLLRALTPAGGSASLGKLEISLYPPRLAMWDFKQSHPSQPSLSLERLRVNVDLNGFWGPQPWLKLVEAEGLSLEIKHTPESDGQSFGLNKLGLVLAMGEARIKNAKLNLLTGQGRLEIELASLLVIPQAQDRRGFDLAGSLGWWDGLGKRLAWAHIKGGGTLDLSPSLEAKLDLTDGGLALPNIEGPLSGSLKLRLTPKQIQIIGLNLGVAQGPGSLTPAGLQMHGHGGLDGKGLMLELQRLALSQRILLSGRFSGEVGDSLSGDLEMHGRAEAGQAAVKQADLSATLGGSLSQPRIKSMAISIPADQLELQGTPLPLGEVQITGAGALEPGNKLRLDNLECKAERLGAFQASLLLDNWQAERASLKATGLAAAGLLAFAQKLIPHAARGWQAQGKLDVSARLGGDKPDQWRASLSSKDLGFSSNDGSVLVGQLAGRLDAAGNMAAQPDIQARLALNAGQALWGTIFIDLAKAPLAVDSKARLAAIYNLNQIKFNGSLGGLGNFSGQGSLALRNGMVSHQGSLALRDLDLAKLFATFVRDPLSISQPALASWQVGGKAQLDLKGSGQGAEAEISGHLRISQANLQTGQGSHLGSLELDLPLAYQLGGPAPKQPPRPERLGWGNAKLTDLQLPGLTLASLELPLALTPNRLWVLGSISVPFAGGAAEISGLQVDDPLSLNFRARFMAQLEGLNLAELAGPSLPLQGSLGGRLRDVTLSKDRLQTRGRLEGNFFGGSIVIRNLSMELPFSPGRELGASIETRQVHMEPLSQALQVGRITGRLDADLRDLRLAYGQPVAFQLRVESIETPGVDQDVSLKAVNSISLLGTGMGLSGMGLNLFASFFKEFPYEKIALSCDLKNDVFSVRGLILEDGVEYLVKRPMLMGINVINRNPDNRISFSDMLGRLQRVQQDNAPSPSGAEAKEER